MFINHPPLSSSSFASSSDRARGALSGRGLSLGLFAGELGFGNFRLSEAMGEKAEAPANELMSKLKWRKQPKMKLARFSQEKRELSQRREEAPDLPLLVCSSSHVICKATFAFSSHLLRMPLRGRCTQLKDWAS